MVTLHFADQVVPWADAEEVFAAVSQTHVVEFRDENGELIARTYPNSDLEREITPDRVAEAQARPFFTSDEMKKKLGWE